MYDGESVLNFPHPFLKEKNVAKADDGLSSDFELGNKKVLLSKASSHFGSKVSVSASAQLR